MAAHDAPPHWVWVGSQITRAWAARITYAWESTIMRPLVTTTHWAWASVGGHSTWRWTRISRKPTSFAHDTRPSICPRRKFLSALCSPRSCAQLLTPIFICFANELFFNKKFLPQTLDNKSVTTYISNVFDLVRRRSSKLRKCCDCNEFFDIVTCTTSTIAHLRLTHCMSVRLASDTDKCVACLTRQQTTPTVQ